MTILQSTARETFVAAHLACAELCASFALSEAARMVLASDAAAFFDAHAADCETFGAALAGECLWFAWLGNEGLAELAFATWPGDAAARLSDAAGAMSARYLIPSEDGEHYLL